MLSHPAGGAIVLPGLPGALPVLQRGPALRLQIVKIGRGIRLRSEVASSDEGVVDFARLGLRDKQCVAGVVIVRAGVKLLLELRDGAGIRAPRQRRFRSESPNESPGGLEFAPAGVPAREPGPRERAPLGLRVDGADQLIERTALGPEREEFRFLPGIQMLKRRLAREKIVESSLELRAG